MFEKRSTLSFPDWLPGAAYTGESTEREVRKPPIQITRKSGLPGDVESPSRIQNLCENLREKKLKSIMGISTSIGTRRRRHSLMKKPWSQKSRDTDPLKEMKTNKWMGIRKYNWYHSIQVYMCYRLDWFAPEIQKTKMKHKYTIM